MFSVTFYQFKAVQEKKHCHFIYVFLDALLAEASINLMKLGNIIEVKTEQNFVYYFLPGR